MSPNQVCTLVKSPQELSSLFIYFFEYKSAHHGTSKRHICKVKFLRRVFKWSLHLFRFNWFGLHWSCFFFVIKTVFVRLHAFQTDRANLYFLWLRRQKWRYSFVCSVLFLIFINSSMESIWVQTAISAIRVIAFVCDVITFPVYLVLQQPWKRRQQSKRIKVSTSIHLIILNLVRLKLVAGKTHIVIAHGTRNMCVIQQSCTCGCDARGQFLLKP